MKALVWAAALSVLLVSSGCAARGSVVAGAPAPYQAGMDEGCSAGFNAAGNPYNGFRKDVQRYSDDGMYKQGWDDGFMRCKGQYEAVGRALR